MPSEPATGNSRRRHGAPPTGYSRIPIRSVSKMNATTAKPGQCADHQRQNQKYLVLTLPQFGHAI